VKIDTVTEPLRDPHGGERHAVAQRLQREAAAVGLLRGGPAQGGRKSSVLAVKRPARPYKSTIQKPGHCGKS
jgi:hypothetical protein